MSSNTPKRPGWYWGKLTEGDKWKPLQVSMINGKLCCLEFGVVQSEPRPIKSVRWGLEITFRSEVDVYSSPSQIEESLRAQFGLMAETWRWIESLAENPPKQAKQITMFAKHYLSDVSSIIERLNAGDDVAASFAALRLAIKERPQEWPGREAV